MFSKEKSTQIDTINLKYTDEELAQQKELLHNVLDAISYFLDKEEPLGFLEEKHVDMIILVENMLQNLLSPVPNMCNISFPQPIISLAYLVNGDDSDSDSETKSQRKKQPEV